MSTQRIILSLFFLTLGFSRSAGQDFLSAEERVYLRKNSFVIADTGNFRNANWEAVANTVKNKRLVLLGEFNHGSKEIFEVKNELIRFLHEKHGFNTVLVESGIGEMITAEFSKTSLSPLQMTYGLFGGWRTAEFKELMNYIKTNDMHIAGFDVQRSGGSFKRVLAEAAAEADIDTLLYNDLEDRFGSVQRELSGKNTGDTLFLKTGRLIAGFQHVKQLLAEKKGTEKTQLVLQTIDNRIGALQYLQQFARDKNTGRRFAARDSMMAQNIKWLCEKIFNHEKVIILAHNYHIAKHNDSLEVMGRILHHIYGDQMYSVGIFAGDGSFSNNTGREEKMLPPDTVSPDLKAVIRSLPGSVNYLPVPAKNKESARWLDRHIIVNDTFINLASGNTMILSKHFDALLFLSKVSPPIKL